MWKLILKFLVSIQTKEKLPAILTEDPLGFPNSTQAKASKHQLRVSLRIALHRILKADEILFDSKTTWYVSL